jgi:hypothetical protein
MEHLQLPRNPTHPHIKVPYLCTDHCDGGPFLQYLDRTGWTTSQILDASQHQHLGRSKEEVQALLQTWFFFGLLTDERRMSQCITMISSILTQVPLRGDGLLDGRLTWSFGVL